MKKILQKENIKYYLTFYIIIEIISRFSIIKGIITGIYGFFDIAINVNILDINDCDYNITSYNFFISQKNC